MNFEEEINKGWVALWRKIEDSEIWEQEPWRLKTWIHFINEANHSDELRYGQKLRRGQVYISSMAELCKQIRWKKGFVYKTPTVNAMKHFWEWLRKRGMVDTRRTTRGTIITILNYRKYQDIPKKESRMVDTSKSPMVDTTQTPTTSHDRQPLKPLEQLNKEEGFISFKKERFERINSSFKSKESGKLYEPFYLGKPMRWSQDKWWVVKENNEWLEYAGELGEIKLKPK